MKQYFSLLDPLRFFAAFWVMNFHYLLATVPNPDLHWYRYGNLGVQIFFIISGFVIVRSLKGKSLKQFAYGRFVRLFPMFWILCTITYALTLLLPDARYVLHFTDYLRSMTMLGDVFIGFAGPAELIDPSYWTLTVELIFYIGIGIFVYFCSFKNIRYFLAAWLMLAAGIFMLHIDTNFYMKLLLVRHASYFVFGAALALIVMGEAQGSMEKIVDWGLLLLSATYATYIHTSALPAYESTNPLDSSIVTVIHVAMFLVIPALVYASRYIRNVRVIEVLAIIGALTYPLYLLHQRIGNILIGVAASTETLPWLTFVISFEIIIIGVAYLVSRQDNKLRLAFFTRH
jgi:peptidoglycan/LPS O-acetylase OafA/YrhL